MTALHNISPGEPNKAFLVEKTGHSDSTGRAGAARELHRARMQSLNLASMLEERNQQVKELTAENGLLREENGILTNSVKNLTETNASLQAINTDQEVQLAENEVELQRLRAEADQSGPSFYRFAAEAGENIEALGDTLQRAWSWLNS